ncbi:Histone-lysine N-methyltransferase ATXR4 [Sesamum angolense]|uniref:Histone-lysine N-methyltransferase ATXR4 n=1 Tax=Sesamum angolense TaxID=2727404 RepID=A0AAE2BNX8_9LAMI|nr:Histone-lysine N-methyltransferase ATXR4 [Sesamum angolense]
MLWAMAYKLGVFTSSDFHTSQRMSRLARYSSSALQLRKLYIATLSFRSSFSTTAPHPSPPPIHVGLTECAGRGVFASRRISAGELIHTAQPIVSHPSLSSLHTVCYFCLRKLPSLQASQTVSFCSTQCEQQSKVTFLTIHSSIHTVQPVNITGWNKNTSSASIVWKEGMDSVSSILMFAYACFGYEKLSGYRNLSLVLLFVTLPSVGFSSLLVLMRQQGLKYPLLVKRMACQVISGAVSSDVLDILQPEISSSDRISKMKKEVALLKNTFVDSDIGSEQMAFLTEEWYAGVLARIRINAFRIELAVGSYEDLLSLAAASVEAEAAVGNAVYVLPSLYNHDCDPNVNIVWVENVDAKVKALRDIEEGEELRICYIDASMDYKARQRILFSTRNCRRNAQTAIEKVLVPYDFMAGRLKWNHHTARLDLHCNSAGAGFVVASSAFCLDEIGDLDCPNPGFRQLAVQTLDYLDEDQLLCVFQVTASTSEVVLQLEKSVNHVLLDGSAVRTFLKNLASQAFQEKPLSVIPCHDRRLLAARSPPLVSFPHPEFLKPQLLARQFTAKAAKQAAADNAVDVRSRLNPPLPPEYCGNAVLPGYASAKCRDVEKWPLSKLVEMILEGIERMSDEYMKSAIDWLEINKGIPYGDYPLTSLSRLGLDEVCVPWQGPEFGLVMNNLECLCWMLPHDDGVKVLIQGSAEEMERFDFHLLEAFSLSFSISIASASVAKVSNYKPRRLFSENKKAWCICQSGNHAIKSSGISSVLTETSALISADHVPALVDGSLVSCRNGEDLEVCRSP